MKVLILLSQRVLRTRSAGERSEDYAVDRPGGAMAPLSDTTSAMRIGAEPASRLLGAASILQGKAPTTDDPHSTASGGSPAASRRELPPARQWRRSRREPRAQARAEPVAARPAGPLSASSEH